MAPDGEAPPCTPTDPIHDGSDIIAGAALRAVVDRIGADKAAAVALILQSDVHAAALLRTARGADVKRIVGLLNLGPGELAAAVDRVTVAPLSLPADEATTIPDEFPDMLVGGYTARQRLVLTSDVPERTAAALALLVDGRRGLVLFMCARGDDRDSVAQHLGITVGEVDKILAEGDGSHVVRPDR